MTAPFLGPDYFLDTATSRRLYHEVAASLPLVDFHNHLDPAAIADDKHWTSIGEIWLEGDHYKWRAMRWNGVPEELVTGATGFREKFDAFAATIPHCAGNPLYHWTHLELRRYFGWNGVFGPETAAEVWEIRQRNPRKGEPQRARPASPDECQLCRHHRRPERRSCTSRQGTGRSLISASRSRRAFRPDRALSAVRSRIC